jgi:cytochrome c oxidase accessory protein FixG
VIQARAVEGRFRRLRWVANALLIAVLLGIPWIRVAGEPLVQLDVPARKFHVFGLVIFPQELYFLWLILAGLALTLFFVTALLGRLWCGWACPQTVFTDVFAAVGRRIQGWKGPRPPARVAAWRRAATHLAWLALSALVAFHLVAYFVPPTDLLARLVGGALSTPAVGFLAVATLVTYVDLGVVRQAFCKYLCPYARFQSVLFDSDTLVIGYDARRGEPRGKLGRATGDCVDCGLCVDVCPTGIDIRDGLQLECIACTQCIDACDGVMERTGRPSGLISYRSLAALEGRRTRLARPRVLIYAALLAVVGVGFGMALVQRAPLDLQVERNSSSLYQTAADGRISNAYTLHIQNRDRRAHVYRIRLEAPKGYQLVAGVNPVVIPATGSLEARVFVLSSAESEARDPQARPARGGTGIQFVLEQLEAPEERIVRASTFMNPGLGDRPQEDAHEG